MTRDIYLADLKRRIETLQIRLETDRNRLAGGAPREEVEAAADLALVESRLAETKQRLARLEAEPEGAWEDLKAGLEEAVDDLESAIEGWIARR